MPSIEEQLISHIVATGRLEEVVRWGITTEDFLIATHKGQFGMLQSHAQMPGSNGKPMGINAFMESNPAFIACHDANTSTDYLCEQIRLNRVAVKAEEANADIARSLKGDTARAIAEAEAKFAGLRALLVRKDTDVTWEESYDRCLREYELTKSGVRTSVCTYPWEPLNKVTKGVEKTDYLVFYGRPKSFKSWLLAWFLVHAYNEGLRVLVYTKEMSPDNIFDRMTAILNSLDYGQLRMAELEPDAEETLYSGREYLDIARRATGQCIIALKGSDVPDGGDTVPWLRSKIAEYKPHILGIDGMYLLSDVMQARKDNERVRNVSRALRQMILSTGVPVIATLQANREEPGEMRDIAFCDDLGRDPTGIYRCVNDKSGPTVSVVVAGAREFALSGFRVWAKPATSFSFHSVLSAKDIERAKENDTGEVENNLEVHAKKKKRTKATAAKKGTSRADKLIAGSMEAVEDMKTAVDNGYRA